MRKSDKWVVLTLFLNLVFLFSCNEEEEFVDYNEEFIGAPFITTWETTDSAENITIYTNPRIYTYDYTVDWGDGSINESVTKSITHTYAEAGIHEVKITGDFPAIFSLNTPNADKIISVESWGDMKWESMKYAFAFCTNLISFPDSKPNLKYLTDMSYMFYGATYFTQDIGDWNVSNVTNMSYMFYDATYFTQDIGDWNVSNVTDMSYMFHGAIYFNQDISDWDVSNVTDMSHMFQNTIAYNQNLSDWSTDKVTNCTDFSLSSYMDSTHLPNVGECFHSSNKDE